MSQGNAMSGGRRPRIPTGQERVVISRSGNRCAYPGCRTRLVFDAVDPVDDDKAVGKVAHICAASPGGPRFDPTMTDKERGSASNLIYLCGDHHDAIDSQTSHHSRAFLEKAKKDHEALLDRAMAYAIGELGFERLETVCSYMVSISGVSDSVGPVAIPMGVLDKMETNSLTAASGHRIAVGLAASGEVARFIDFASQSRADFGSRLRAFFKSNYLAGIAAGLGGDDLFEYVLAHATDHAGPELDEATRAGALAVVCHMFEICEVFENANSAA